MIDYLLGVLAPHHCYGCGKTGCVLCENCIFDIKNEPFERCLVCLAPSLRGLCQKHRLPYTRAWCVAEREGVLRKVVDDYKFMRVWAAHPTLARLLDETIGVLPEGTIITAVPSIPAHIRQRGYDHAALLARQLAQRREAFYQPVLQRREMTVQRGASRAVRREQAKRAFAISGNVEKDRPYLIIDDVCTTGATVRYAAQALREAGASEVWVAVLVRQVSTDGS